MNSNPTSIFIADDNKVNRLLLQSQLESYCCNITLAADGKTALAYLRQCKFDLILLDLQMPYFSGLELIKRIKQTNCINKDSPAIAITAHAQAYHRKAVIEAGFDECLIKPIFLDQLGELLHLWLPLPLTKSPTNNKPETIDYVSALLERTSGNMDLATIIFDKLFTELPEQSQLIEQAIKSNDLVAAQEVTHKLHGSVSFCGFFDIQELAYNLEVSLLEKNIHLIHSNFILLKDKTIDFINLKETIVKRLI